VRSARLAGVLVFALCALLPRLAHVPIFVLSVFWVGPDAKIFIFSYFFHLLGF